MGLTPFVPAETTVNVSTLEEEKVAPRTGDLPVLAVKRVVLVVVEMITRELSASAPTTARRESFWLKERWATAVLGGSTFSRTAVVAEVAASKRYTVPVEVPQAAVFLEEERVRAERSVVESAKCCWVGSGLSF